MKSFLGNYCRLLAIFFWSHWWWPPRPINLLIWIHNVSKNKSQSWLVSFLIVKYTWLDYVLLTATDMLNKVTWIWSPVPAPTKTLGVVKYDYCVRCVIFSLSNLGSECIYVLTLTVWSKTRWQSSSEFELIRSDACELVVVFLSHDDCMKQIYSVDDGRFVDVFTGSIV